MSTGQEPSLGRNGVDHRANAGGIAQIPLYGSTIWYAIKERVHVGHSQHLTCALIYDANDGFRKNTTFIIEDYIRWLTGHLISNLRECQNVPKKD